MASLTRVPLVVSTLVDLWRTAMPTIDVQDGAIVGELPDKVVVVGIPDGQDTGYSATVSRQQGMGRTALREDWTVRCLASVAIASDDLPAARLQVAELLAILDDAVRVAPLTAWQAASITGDVVWMPMRTQGGAVCNVLFSVTGSGLL